MSIDVRIENVTPEMAAGWLTKNHHNRRLNARVVADYARDMASGAWEINGEAIKFAEDGTLLDGQHRLAAVKESGVTVKLLTLWGLHIDTQKTMDAGRKRTLADNLGIEGVENSAVVAAIASRMWMWDGGNVDLTPTVRPTQAEQREWIDANPVVYRAAQIAMRTRATFKPATPSIMGVAYVLFNRIDASDTAQFFASLGTGADLKDSSAILMLRNRMIRDSVENRRVNDKVRLGLTVKAWNHFRRDEEPKGLLMTPENKMPTPE